MPAYCLERGIPYTETTLAQSSVQILRYLNQVGLAARPDTFSCPLVQQYRS